MNRLLITCIGAAAATVAISYVLHRQALPEHQGPPSSTRSMTPDILPTEITANDDRRLELPDVGAATDKPLPTGDMTGLLQETITVGELLDEIDADTGEEFTPIDRERLTALLRSDPELRRAVRE